MNATRKHVHRKISSACNLGIISKKLLRQPWSPRALLYTHVWQLIPRSGSMLKPLVNKCPANRFYDHSVSVFFNKNQESKHSLIYVMYYSYRCECASVCVWDWPRPREGHYFVAKHEGAAIPQRTTREKLRAKKKVKQIETQTQRKQQTADLVG